MKKQLSLAQKILRISKAAGQVKRTGTAEDGNSYATIGDVLDAVKKLMDRYGVILIPGDHCDFSGTVVVMSWKVGHEGEWMDISVPGGGDGPHAISQAVTVSRKKAMECLFNLRIEEGEAATTEERKELAETLGDKKAEQARKRAENKAAKECVTVSWPEEHHGNKALFRGRVNIMEHADSFAIMEELGKYVERLDGWLVEDRRPRSVEDIVEGLRVRGCTVKGVRLNGLPL